MRYIATVGIKGLLGRDSAVSDINLATPEYDANARRLSRTRRKMVAQLVAIREARGLSQSQVAKAIGIHRSGVCKFEADGATANPTLEVLLRYAHAVGASIDVDVHRAEEPAAMNYLVITAAREIMAKQVSAIEEQPTVVDGAVVHKFPTWATRSSVWSANVEEFAAR